MFPLHRLETMTHLRRLATAAIVSATLLCATGCKQGVDLSAVAAFSKSVADSRDSFDELADDFRASCIRTAGWLRASDPAGTSTPDVQASCSDNAAAARQWQAADSVVTSYIAALGELAGGNDSGDYGLASFAQSFGKLGVTKSFTADRQKSVSGAAASFLDAYFKAKRREALGPILVAADPDVDRAVTVLEDIARTNYATQLTTERLSIALFYGPTIARAHTGLEVQQAFAYRTAEHQAEADVDTKQGAIDPYVEALENIKVTHHKLTIAVSSNDFASVSAIVEGYIASYKSQVAALHKAFKQ